MNAQEAGDLVDKIWYCSDQHDIPREKMFTTSWNRVASGIFARHKGRTWDDSWKAKWDEAIITMSETLNEL